MIQMAFYEHDEDCNSQLTMIDNNPHDARCGRCGRNFCSLCNKNAHFPATCTEMLNWKERRDLGHQHFAAYNWCIDSWARLDQKSLAAREKMALLPNNNAIDNVDDIVLIQSLSDELKQIIHLLRWTWVILWHYPTHYLFYNNTFLASLELAFDDLLAAVPSYLPLNFHYVMNGPRTRASVAANNLLGVLVVIRGMRDHSFFKEMERWRARPLRGCP